jgi:hypothetical protein
MKKVLQRSLVLALGVALVSSAAYAKKGDSGYGAYTRTSNWSDVMTLDNPAAVNNGGLNASAVATTVVLNSSKFDSGATCTANSWVTTDITQQTGDWWHVDDFTTAPWAGTFSTSGIMFNPVQGSRSMWMAALPPVGPLNTILCGYAALPGYGNGWNQAFCTKTCLTLTGDLNVAFKLKFDSEPSYDGSTLQYTTDCAGNVGWTDLAGGITPAAPGGGWSGADSITVIGAYPVGPGPVKVRLHFTADTSWSNQDGFWPGFGVAIDSLKAEGLALENFEATAIGAHSSTDWTSCNTPGFGNYLALFKKATGANYEDQCLDNLSCYWAAIQGSTEFYTCGSPSQPTQKVIPHVNVRAEYLSNEIWSPVMSLAGSSGSDFRLRYTVYRDLPLDNLIFHVWHTRTIDTGGCPGAWADRNFVYYGDQKDWTLTENAIGSKVNVATGASIQVAIGVLDMCPFWCGIFGTGLCHSPAPYIDSVKVLRIDTIGPQWDIRDIDTFNDNFSADGTITGTARFDEAIDIKPSSSVTYTPGDSGIVLFLIDPKYVNAGFTTLSAGLINDGTASTFVGRNKTKNAVYMYATVTPFSGAKISAAISEGPGGTANRYPFMGTIVAGGKTWAKVRMDYTYTGTAATAGLGTGTQPRVANRFNVDLNDNLFTPGDTIEYFYSASSLDGTTYFSTNWGSTTNVAEVAANPMEVTILPAGGFNRGGDILYVDGADGFGVQNYYDGAFLTLGLASKIDRFDVRGPSSGVSNRLSGKVTSVANQLNACYQKIIWDSGLLSITLGDGSGDPEKTDDYATMNSFLNGLTNAGGVMLLGDRQPTYLNGYAGASAVSFRSVYMPFTLINDNHRLAPSLFAISPKMMAWPGRAYSDNFVLFGGCPGLNDFDVIGASGTSRVEMSYNTASNANGGVVSNVTVNGNLANATVIMTGFSLGFVRDDELDGISDRAKFLRDSFVYMGNPLGQVTGAGPALKNSLTQNYPNPFNPQTTIEFTLKDRGAMTLKVYNVNGQLVRTLIDGVRAAGPDTKVWDGHNDAGQSVSSGVYFYKLVTNNFSQTKKMVLLK